MPKPGNDHPGAERAAPRLLAAVLITATLAAIGFGLVIAIVELIVKPVDLPAPFPTENQKAETAIFAVSLLALLPASIAAGPRLEARIREGPSGGALPALAWLLLACVAASTVVLSVLPGGGGIGEALAVFAALAAGAGALIVVSIRGPAVGALLASPRRQEAAIGAAGAVILGSVLVFTDPGSIAITPLVLGALAVAAVAWVYARGSWAPPRLGRRGGLAFDVAVIAVLLLVIPQLDVFGAPGIRIFHQNLWLGPTDRILGGHALLVDNASQYGIGSLYFLAAWFKLVPIGYGTLSLLDGILFALFFACGYGVLRLAKVSRLVAAAALALAVPVLTYNLLFPVGTIPQHGPLRFGLPLVLVAVATWGARSNDQARGPRILELGVLALASVWMFETLAYTALTYAGLLAYRAWGPDRRGLRWALRSLMEALLAVAVAQIVLVMATRIAAGHWPDYGLYFSFLHSFFFGPLSHLTFDFTDFSPGILAGFAYAVNAAAVVITVQRRPDVVRARPAAFAALAGLATFGLVLFSYFVDRSEDLVLPYVSLPLVLCAALWLDLILGGLAAARRARVSALVATLAMSLLVLTVAWSRISLRFAGTPAAHIIPGGESLGSAVDAIRNPPPLDARAPVGVDLLNRYSPGEKVTPMIVSSDPGVEVTMRSGRFNALPFSDPFEDSFVERPSAAELAAAIDRLEPGQRVLTQVSALRVLAALAKDPGRDLINDPVDVSFKLTPEQELALQELAARFKLKLVDRGPAGFAVLELGARR